MDTRIGSLSQNSIANLSDAPPDANADASQDQKTVSKLLANLFGGSHDASLSTNGVVQSHVETNKGEVLKSATSDPAGSDVRPGGLRVSRLATDVQPAGAESVQPTAASSALASTPSDYVMKGAASDYVMKASTTDATAASPDTASADDGQPPSEFVNGFINPAFVRYQEAQSADAAAAAASAAATTNDPNQLTDDQIATLSVLDRHQDKVKGSMSDLQKQIDDPKTPPDLKQALENLKNDPDLQAKLDSASNGKTDSKFSPKDVTNLVKKHPEVQTYNEQQADAFEQNYIPSDSTDSDAQPREIDANDAMRELYRYSDYLPKNLSKEDLQNIVDGTGGEGKMPPQVIAAAKYFLNHPSDWQTVAGPSGSISRGHLEDAISKNVSLNDDENKTIATLQANESTFFGDGSLSRSKLEKIENDPNSSPEVQQAAKQLLGDPMLFGMLDNGKHGNSGNLLHAADDGKIGKGDFEAFVNNSKTLGKPAPPTPPTHTASAPRDVAAVQAMQAGEADQPDQKKEKGGGLQKFFQGLLHIFAKILDALSTVLSVLAKIPIIGEIFAGASMAAEAVSGQLEVGAVAVGGGSKQDIINAEKDAAIGLVGAAIGTVTVPGAGGAMVKGAIKGVEDGAETVAKRSDEIYDGVKEGVKDVAKDNAKDTAYSQAQQAVSPQPQDQSEPVAA
jgi:type III secretion translocon protein HrpF